MKKLLTAAVLAIMAILSGCHTGTVQYDPSARPIEIKKCSGKINIDGKINEKAWADAAVYDLKLYDGTFELPPLEKARVQAEKFAPGQVRLLYDRNYVYVSATFCDKDIIGLAPADQMRLHMHGDLLELFFHPENAMHFWEFHAAPNSRSAAFYFLTGDMLSLTELTGQTKLPQGLKCAATLKGKINNQKKADKSWTVEMQIPRQIFAAAGTPFAPGQKWRIRLGRWNASHNLYAVQKSYFPEQPYNRALQRQYFAPVVFK